LWYLRSRPLNLSAATRFVAGGVIRTPLIDDTSARPSILPEPLEPIRRQRRISSSRLQISISEVVRQAASVVTVIR
jgi:hypothetical protein